MKIDKFVITGVVMLGVLLIIAFNLFKIMAPKERAPQIAEGQVPAKEGPYLNYAIPANAIPTVQDIEANMKKTEENKRLYNEVQGQIEKEKAISTEKEIAAVEEVVTASPKEKPQQKSVVLPQKKEVAFPTYEERQKTESRGIVTY